MKPVLCTLISLLILASYGKTTECPGIPEDIISWNFFHHGQKHLYKSSFGDSAEMEFIDYHRAVPSTCTNSLFHKDECACDNEARISAKLETYTIAMIMNRHNHDGLFHSELTFKGPKSLDMGLRFNLQEGSDKMFEPMTNNSFDYGTYDSIQVIGGKTYHSVYTYLSQDTVPMGTPVLYKVLYSKDGGLIQLHEQSPYKVWTKQ